MVVNMKKIGKNAVVCKNRPFLLLMMQDEKKEQ